MKFDGASPNVQTEQQNLKPYYHNYYLGKDARNWASKVPLSEVVMYQDLYPGISVKTFSSNNNIRYDFIVEPQADPSQIRLKFEGQNHLYLKNEELVIATEVGEILQEKPVAYQEVDGEKRKVSCTYKLDEENTLSFGLTGSYDHSKPLIIDPTLVFATFTGSTGDNWGMSASYDSQGNGYSTGICFATGYPLSTGAFQQTFNGGVTNSTYTYLGFDISVSKFDAGGSNLIYSTYLGGSDNEQPMSIIADNNDNLVIYGRSYSTNFPVTTGAYSQTLGGGSDIIITKFNSSGTALLASTFVGGSNDDGVNFSANEATLGSLKYNYADDGRGDIIIDNNNNVFIATCTISNNFPVTPGCFQPANGGMQDACVFKMDPNLSTLTWSTYLGGNANDAAYSLAADNSGSVYITGGTESPNFPVSGGALHGSYMGNIDGFLTHLSSGGNSVLQSTYIGTTAYDQSYFVQLDNNSNVYIYGQTEGPYPVSAGVYSNPNSGQFIHEFDPALSNTIFSTVFGTGSGKPDIAPSAFLVDKCNNIYISGWGGTLGGYNIPNSTTNGLPVTGNAFQSNTDGMDFYFLVLQKNGTSLWYATYFGGTHGSEEHVDGGTSRFDKSGVIYQAICEGCAVNPLTNYTPNSDMPTTPNAWSTTNNSNNCNNALVKFSFDLKQTVASLSLNPLSTTGCAPFTVNFGNQSINSVKYQWNFGDGTSSTQVTPTHIYTNPGTYTVQLIAIDTTTCNMRDTAYGSIQVYPPVTVAPTATLTVCSADSARLNANAINATSINWVPTTGLNNPNIANPASFTQTSITYTVTASNGVCSATDTITVKGISGVASPQITGGDSISFCTYDSVKLSVAGTYTAYQWNTGQTNSSIEATHAGVYIVTTYDHFGCKGTDSVHVYEFSYVGWPMRDTTICDGQAAFLQEAAGNYTYHWSPAYGLSSTTISNPQAHPHVTTTYSVIVQNGPCITSNTVTVHVNPLPDLHASPLKADILPGEEVQLVATSHDSVVWSPATALSCTNCPMPVATPDDDITYMVITGDPKTGCIDSAYITIIVEGSFYVPNTFTPNGDYINQIFKPVCMKVYDYTMMIFDRWGNHIFTTTDTEIGWDGTFHGKPCQEDVYVYKIEYMQKHSTGLHSVSGHVNLVR
jgi:gliding motility-associated-like protein